MLICQKFTLYTFLLFRYDWLDISDGYNGWDTYFGQYSAGQQPARERSPMRTPSNFAYIQFLSDNTENKPGFVLQYEIGE